MADVPEGSVVITPAEVYSKVVELTTVVTEMVAADKADTKARDKLEERVDGHDRALDAIKGEVGSIKQKLWFVAGFCSAVGGGLGSALAPLLVR